MTVKVIGAGFGRTGTLSLKVALEKLGFTKCHHMQEVFKTPGQIDQWAKVAEAREPPDWDAVFEGFQATTDFPSSPFYLQLSEHFPDAKVVLTYRDEDSWYKSVRETIFEIWRLIPSWLLVIPSMRRGYQAVDTLVWQNVFDGRVDDPDHAKAVFRSHNEAVQVNIPHERLLVYQVKEGWAPLCDFLGVPIPDEPFPHVNDTAEMKRRIMGVKALRAAPYVLLAVLVLVILV